MNCLPALLFRPLWALACFSIAAGCTATFTTGSAREVSRDRLLQICESGKTDHLQYMGSDFNYHYVYDSRPGKKRTYKVRINDMKLTNTFSLGEDSYVLLPWVIEGRLMGSKSDDLKTGNPGVESTDKPRQGDEVDGESDESGVGRAAQPVVQGAAQADLWERLGDDQIETGRVQAP